ncbi:hypothetical protein ACFU80_24955, partial [Streptomyces erythrochromogenes]
MPVEELWAALTRIAPDAVATFDAERAAPVARAREQVSSAPRSTAFCGSGPRRSPSRGIRTM